MTADNKQDTASKKAGPHGSYDQRTVVRSLARHLLGPEEQARLKAPAGVQPQLQPLPSSLVHHVSLSHTRTGAAAAIATGPVGIDVESIHRRANWQRIASQCFTSREQHWLAKQPETLRKMAFLELWTCKEAWLKAQGLGLSQLEQASFAPQNRGPWHTPGSGWRAQTRLYGELVVSLLWQGSCTPHWQQARLDGTTPTAIPDSGRLLHSGKPTKSSAACRKSGL